MTNEPRDLLATVDLLTLPSFEHIAQGGDGNWRVRSVQVPPLLELMRDAVLPSGGKDAGSKSLPNTRNPVDWDAMLAYHRMLSTAAGWAHDAGSVPTRDPIRDLRAWYAATLTDNARDDDWYRRHLNGWVVIIRAHLEPPESFVIQRACPVCRVEAYGNAIDGGDQWPIEVRYRKNDDGRILDEVAHCRAGCNTVWRGHESIMELAEELAEGAA